MQRIDLGIFLLVIVAITVLSLGMFISTPNMPGSGNIFTVNIEGIEYTSSNHSILKIDFFKDVPEEGLEGNVTVYQNEKQWTSEVTWYYTGYGEAEIVCDSIDETQNFRVAYMDGSLTLERIFEWNEVARPIPFVATE